MTNPYDDSSICPDVVDDFKYFLKKLEEAKTEEEIKKYQRRIKLLLDALVVYRL